MIFARTNAPLPAHPGTYARYYPARLQREVAQLVARRWSRESVTQTTKGVCMEQFIRSLIDLVNKQIGPLEAEYQAYTDLRQRLMDLLKVAAEDRQAQLKDDTGTKPAYPKPPGALTELVYGILKTTKGALSFPAIYHACLNAGWESTSQKPKNVLITALSTLRRRGVIRRKGTKGEYRYFVQ